MLFTMFLTYLLQMLTLLTWYFMKLCNHLHVMKVQTVQNILYRKQSDYTIQKFASWTMLVQIETWDSS